MASATHPKLAYPGNIPNRLRTTIRVVIPNTPNPRPPCSTGSDRYGGIQVKSPHHANNAKKLKNKSASVCRTNGGRKMARVGTSVDLSACPCESPAAFLASVDFPFHISDSDTLRWIHSVTSAGRIPTKNTARHP